MDSRLYAAMFGITGVLGFLSHSGWFIASAFCGVMFLFKFGRWLFFS
jgi:hypothetical protein